MCCKETCLRAICLQQRGSSMQQRLPTATGAPAKPLQRVRKAGADGRGNALDGAKAGLTDPISPPIYKAADPQVCDLSLSAGPAKVVHFLPCSGRGRAHEFLSDHRWLICAKEEPLGFKAGEQDLDPRPGGQGEGGCPGVVEACLLGWMDHCPTNFLDSTKPTCSLFLKKQSRGGPLAVC